MIELLSLVFGGLLRLAPEVLKLVTAKRDAEHEYRMTQLQLEIDKARAEQQLDLVHAQGAIAASTAEMTAMVEALRAQAQPSGIAWVDALSSSVRPVLTYYHLIVIYTAVKVAQFVVASQGGIPWPQAMLSLYTDADRSLAWSMASFWFIDRSLRKAA